MWPVYTLGMLGTGSDTIHTIRTIESIRTFWDMGRAEGSAGKRQERGKLAKKPGRLYREGRMDVEIGGDHVQSALPPYPQVQTPPDQKNL